MSIRCAVSYTHLDVYKRQVLTVFVSVKSAITIVIQILLCFLTNLYFIRVVARWNKTVPKLFRTFTVSTLRTFSNKTGFVSMPAHAQCSETVACQLICLLNAHRMLI